MGLSFIKSSSSLKVFIHTPNQIFEMENKEQSYSSFKKKKKEETEDSLRILLYVLT
jgi:hypothetical protein